MVGAMAKLVELTEDNDLVIRAKTQAEALGRLYEMYYERIFRFCVHRLFNKEIAEDVTVKKPVTNRLWRRNIMFKDEAGPNDSGPDGQQTNEQWTTTAACRGPKRNQNELIWHPQTSQKKYKPKQSAFVEEKPG